MMHTKKRALFAVCSRSLEVCLLLSLGWAMVGMTPDPAQAQAAAVPPSLAAVNVEGNGFWTVGPTWTDLTKLLSPWGRYDSPWASDSSIPVNSDGYPLVDAGAGTPMVGYPLGTYTLRYEGTGEVTVVGLGRLSGPVVKGPDGVWQAPVIVDQTNAQTGNQLYIRFRNSASTDRIRNLHLIMPGYGAINPPTFSNEFLGRLRPFSSIRFMDWGSTNGSPLRSWADRTPQASILQTTEKGVAYEYMIALANQTGKDPWITVPVNADDQFVQQLARLVAGSLDPGLDVYVEYSNELWNGGFPQYNDNLTYARNNPLLTRADDHGRAAEQAAYRTKRIGEIFRQEFGAGANRVKPVLGGQAAWTFFQEVGLQFLARNGGDPRQSLACVAVAPYLNLADSVNPQTLDALFSSLRNEALPRVNGWIDQSKALATRYGLPMIAYEGGQHLVNYPSPELFRQAQHDPRMGSLLRDHFAHWKAVGGGRYAYFQLAALEKPWGTWGALTGITEPGSVKWDALLSGFLPQGDSTLDRVVNYDDFGVLSGNFNRPGKWWWQQGDLNANNLVNGGDLAILRGNLLALTPGQAVNVGLFDVPGTATRNTRIALRAASRAELMISYTWTVTLDGKSYANGTGPALDFVTTKRRGTHVVSLMATSAGGSSASGSRTIIVN